MYEIGEKAGNWIIVDKFIASTRNDKFFKRNNYRYLMQCECGNKMYMSYSLVYECAKNKRRDCGLCCHVKLDPNQKKLVDEWKQANNYIREPVNSNYKVKNISGEKFGKLLVIESLSNKFYNEKRRKFWLCLCDCGKVCVTTTNSLCRGNCKSCGCLMFEKDRYNFVDLTGKTFGKLKVLEKSEEKSKSRGVIWICECECGKTTKLTSNSLTSGNTKSCGRQIHKKKIIKTGDIPNSFLTNIRSNAIKRNMSFNLEYDFLWELFKQQNGRCALSGKSLSFDKKNITASLDRKNSDIGYEKDNVQWTHKDINRSKLEFKESYYKDLCKKVYQHNINHIEEIERPDWDSYFIMLAHMCSLRSMDAQTQHGCVITDYSNHILGTGYNSFAKNMPDEILANKRDVKYKYMIHSEESALLNCSISLHSLEKGAKSYITGKPCLGCLNKLITANVTSIYYPKGYSWNFSKEEEEDWLLAVYSSGIQVYLLGHQFDSTSKYFNKILSNIKNNQERK